MSIDLGVGDYAVFKDSSDIHTAPVYEVVGSDVVVTGDDFQHTVDLIPTDGLSYRPVAVIADRLIRVAGPVGGSRRPDFNNGEEPDIVY